MMGGGGGAGLWLALDDPLDGLAMNGRLQVRGNANWTGAVDSPAPHVDLAICLDTSGSMDGLINAARQNIWAIVNDLALAKPSPRLRIALLTFGNDGHDAGGDGGGGVEEPVGHVHGRS